MKHKSSKFLSVVLASTLFLLFFLAMGKVETGDFAAFRHFGLAFVLVFIPYKTVRKKEAMAIEKDLSSRAYNRSPRELIPGAFRRRPELVKKYLTANEQIYYNDAILRLNK